MTLCVGSACPIALLTGLPCPGCGLTRACIAALTLHWKEAFALHPLFLLIPVVGALVVLGTAKPAVCRTRPFEFGTIALAAVFLVCYVVRMILLFPHTAPYAYNYTSLLGLIIRACSG